MFGGTKQEPRRGGLSVIGADVTVKGDVTTDGDLHIDGRVEGDVRCGSIVQGPSGRIVGHLHAKTARLAGTIDGEVDAAALTVQASARINGDSVYESLTIETGAQVDGRMTHRGATDGAGDPPLRLVDASDPSG